MFTGIIQEVGIIAAKRGSRLGIRTSLRARAGESVAINGACLTVISPIKRGILSFDVSEETFRLTNLSTLRPNVQVNLEPALKAGDALGGHMLSGHVDAKAKILSIETLPESFVRLRVALPAALKGLVALKGSIAVDGISLTVTAASRHYFETVLVPHTLKNTNLGERRKGDAVNLEADLIARYVKAALAAGS